MSHTNSLSNNRNRQAGLGTYALVGVLVGLGVVFLTIFFLANSGGGSGQTGNNGQSNTSGDQTANGDANQTASKEPPYIRIPENSQIYKSSQYFFSLAYPSSFQKLTENSDSSAAAGSSIFQATAINADKKPIGSNGAILTGQFGAYVYRKDDFKILVGTPDIYVGATKTGNDTTWKVVSKGNTTQDINVGSAFPVKTTKSQTGVTVFNFTLNRGKSVFGRYVFEAGDYYVLVALPDISLPSGANLTDKDLAPYNVIGTNLASTIRVSAKPSNGQTDDKSTSQQSSGMMDSSATKSDDTKTTP